MSSTSNNLLIPLPLAQWEWNWICECIGQSAGEVWPEQTRQTMQRLNDRWMRAMKETQP